MRDLCALQAALPPCECGAPVSQWSGRGRHPIYCDRCRFLERNKTHALSYDKRKQRRPKRVLSTNAYTVILREWRIARMEKAGKVRCACGDWMWRMTMANRKRKCCQKCMGRRVAMDRERAKRKAKSGVSA